MTSESNANTTVQEAYLRINADKVGKLMDMVGELGLIAAEIIHHPDLSEIELDGFENSAHRLELLIRELQDEASSLRLVPVKTVFQRMQRLVRDLAKQTNKKIKLVLKGEDTEIDKVLVDALYDPLVHLIRNSADHGIRKSPDAAADEPISGSIFLEASHHGGEIQIVVADDGQGMNRDAILTKARTVGLCGPDEEPTDQQVWSYIFEPGFSTTEEVSKLSGRGVGMDVVRTTIRSLRGRIAVESKTGIGTRFILGIPLTLAFLDSMLVRIGRRCYALSVEVVIEVFKVKSDMVTRASVDGSEMVTVRNQLVPILHIHQFYDEEMEEVNYEDMIMVIISTTKGQIGIPVDEVISHEQVTIKPLEGRLKEIRAGSGCALLASGEVAIVLDCEQLVMGIKNNNS